MMIQKMIMRVIPIVNSIVIPIVNIQTLKNIKAINEKTNQEEIVEKVLTNYAISDFFF